MRIKWSTVLLYLSIIIVGNFLAYIITHIPSKLYLLIIFASAVFYPIVKYPGLGIYIVVAISPFISFIRRLYYLKFSRERLDPLLVFPELIASIVILGLFWEFKKKRNIIYSSWSVALVLYMSYMVIRVFFLNISSVAEAIPKFEFYGPPVLFFFIGLLFANRKEYQTGVWIITFFSGIIVSLYGFKQLFLGYSISEKIWFNSIKFITMFIGGAARPFSTFQSPVAFADYMQLAAIATLYFSEKIKNNIRYFILFFLPLFFYSSLTTSVRSNWIGFLMSVSVWYTVLLVKTNKKRIYTIVALSVFLISVNSFMSFIGTDLSFKEFISLVSGSGSNQVLKSLIEERAVDFNNILGEHSIVSRLSLWRNILLYTRDPLLALFGRGLGTLKADSLYMTYLAEFGYPGLIFILLLFANLFRAGFLVVDKSDKETSVFAKSVMVFDIIFGLMSITGTHIHYFPGSMYFWFLNGLLIGIYLENDKFIEGCKNEGIADS